MKPSAAISATLSVALAATVLLAGGPASAQGRHGGGHPDGESYPYGTKTPYEPQGRPKQYERAPKGYLPVFTENVARHGSRAMTDSEDGDLVLAVLGAAEQRGALTRLGAGLAPQVRTLLGAASAVGYGNLAGRGVREHRETALRMEQRLPELFRTIAAEHEPVVVETSGVARTVASADAFTSGLTEGQPSLAGLIKAPVTDKNLLYFHKQPQNADYQAYLAHDPDLAAVLAGIEGGPRTEQAARHVAERLLDAEFVTSMSAEDRIAFARALHQLYSSAPDLAEEAPTVDLDPYLTSRDAQWFAYLDDAEEFYQKGPGFAGRTITYRMAQPLLDDLFAAVEAKAAGTGHDGAVLRFTHAEEIEPLAALMGLPGSTEPAAPDEPYSYRNDEWRGGQVSPMAANVQWDLYAGGPGRDGAGKGGAGKGVAGKSPAFLVRMLYNEQETAFKSSCRPIAKGSYFYDLDELRRCFGRA
ncbi:histidine-type phosphatase [Kitasatospora herbaricolor]|uniref:Multiple inositol polyphosphate phosphatase 1 n=1 Tax=Kitasatospora herbaricolor TaxID=68217 RepID=A0ABZ1WG72_9ACTN|nr:histidine-type phosphatase [Kitasatospora herbaricolor]